MNVYDPTVECLNFFYTTYRCIRSLVNSADISMRIWRNINGNPTEKVFFFVLPFIAIKLIIAVMKTRIKSTYVDLLRTNHYGLWRRIFSKKSWRTNDIMFRHGTLNFYDGKKDYDCASFQHILFRFGSKINVFVFAKSFVWRLLTIYNI